MTAPITYRPDDDPDPLQRSMPSRLDTATFWPVATLLIVVAGVLHGVMIWRAAPLQSANDRSRWCTVRALLEHGTYQIDAVRTQPGWDTIDLVSVDGHYYSTKPPLQSTWVAGVSWLISQGTGWRFGPQTAELSSTTLLIVNLLPFLLMLVAWAILLTQITRSLWAAVFSLTTLAFGTLLTPFLATLNNHTAAATGVAFATMIGAWLTRRRHTKHRDFWFAAWGFAAGWAAAHELPALAFTAFCAWQAWRIHSRDCGLKFIPAAGLPLVAFLVVNAVATGELVPTYASYGSSRYEFTVDGIPSYWSQPQGIDRNLDSPPVYLFHCLLGHHGLLSLSPLVAFALVAPFLVKREEAHGLHRWLIAATALTAIVLGFYLTRTKNYNYGGVSCALRWMVFLWPLWCLSLVLVAERFGHRRWWRSVMVAALGVGIFSAWESAGRPWQHPWLYRLMDRWGWIDYYRDVPPPLEQPLWTWFDRLPLPTSDGSPVWIEWLRNDAHGQHERWRWTWLEDQAIGSTHVAVIESTRTSGQQTERRRLFIDRDQFKAGEPPAKFLVWPDANVTGAEQQADLALVRGLPLLKAYSPGFVRYLKTPLQTTALRCQRVAAQLEDGDPARRYRCDAWLCPDVPFGVARMDWSISDPATGSLLQQESWTVIACEPAPSTDKATVIPQ